MCHYRFLAQQDLALLLFKTHRSHLAINGCLDLKLPLNKCEASTTTLSQSQNSFSDLLRGNWVQSSSGVQIILSSQKETDSYRALHTVTPVQGLQGKQIRGTYFPCIKITKMNFDGSSINKTLETNFYESAKSLAYIKQHVCVKYFYIGLDKTCQRLRINR